MSVFWESCAFAVLEPQPANVSSAPHRERAAREVLGVEVT
jgi:hypothetical protein